MKTNELYALKMKLVNEIMNERFSWHKIAKLIALGSIASRD